MDKVDVLTQKANAAETNAAKWLAEGNLAADRGSTAKAAACYDKSQFWHDRANNLRDRLSTLTGAAQ